MQNIILCGGSGTRLWPLSRTKNPKQFLQIFNKKSLFELTVQRNQNLCTKTVIVSNMDQQFLAQKQITGDNFEYIIEPIGRNTAPAIALACLQAEPEEILLVTPSDHLILNQQEYKKTIKEAEQLAFLDNLVTFGIKPDKPETGFGYLEVKGNNVSNFHEKPDLATATEYLNAGNYYWNSGMFCFKAKIFLEELEKHHPKLLSTALKAYNNAKKTSSGNTLHIDYHDMLAIPKESIDYAVMEKSSKVKVIPADINWSDLGSFDSLYEVLPKTDKGNTQSENLVALNSKNNLVVSENRKIALIDIEDLLLVDTEDALLVAKKGKSQNVKEIVEVLNQEKSELINVHKTILRPWGSFTILEDLECYKSKRISVLPGKRLSLQSHEKRDELWQIIKGQALVTIDDQEHTLSYGEKAVIKRGQKHRVENCGEDLLEFIEIQTGDYFGEDDITRYQDDFGRK